MSPSPIRQDIHERFITVVARAEAKLKGEQKAVERGLAAAGLDTDGDDENEGEPSLIAKSAFSTTASQGSRSE